MRILSSRLVLVVAATTALACGGGANKSQQQSASTTAAPANRANVSLDKNSYPVFPDADAGADPSVPAEQGGKGFKGDGWQTNTDYELMGDPRAVKGGTYREYQPDFPTTLRIHGPDSNSIFNYMVGSMVYESLLSLHPSTLEYVPALATHWQISPDKMTFRYRIDPNARWSDGQPVVADDVVATWSLLTDKTLQDPSEALVYGKFDKPVAESKYIVRVHAKELNWRNFLYFSASMQILPSHILKNVDGAAYVRDYNFKLLPGTGPYEVREADVVKGKSVAIHRRAGYWGEKIRRNIGTGNFDTITEIIVRDRSLATEMFKKGDLDVLAPVSAQDWVEQLGKLDKVEAGLIQRRKVHNESPQGTMGLAINMRNAPLDDVKVREALQHLLNRPLIIEKLLYNEYQPINSYYAGTPYANPNNPKNEYDPAMAVKLLADAGWKDRDAQGRLTKNGQPLSIEVLYFYKQYESALTTYQEDLRKVGISLNLRYLTPETLYTLVGQRKFQLALVSLGGLVFPNPETSVSSAFADQLNNNNFTGFKNKRVDELLPIYDKEFDQKKRVAIVREIDGLEANSHDYVLFWEPAYIRMAFWNKFGMPPGTLSRFGDYTDPPGLWWIDPAKEAALKQAMGNNGKLPVGPVDDTYWVDYAKQHPAEESEGFSGKK